MPRPRKSRLVPSLSTFAEELVRVLNAHVDRTVTEARSRLEAEIGSLRREVARLRIREAGPASARGGRPRSSRSCSVAGCELPHVARGLCKNHY